MTKKTPNRARFYYALFWVFLVLTAGCGATIFFFGIRPVILAVNEITLLLCMGLYIIYKKHHYTDAIELVNTTAANIEDTQLQLVSFNEHLRALNDFTKDLSDRTDRTEICESVSRMLVNKFKYDASQFWLFNFQKNRLEFIASSGHDDSIMQKFIANRGAETGKLLLNRVFNQKKILTSSDVHDHLDQEEGAASLFSEFFNLISFAITPLLIEDNAIGVLTVEYLAHPTTGEKIRGEKKSIGERDCLLLESITNFVSDVLVKTDLFQDMEQQIAERTQELTRINDELLRTKELAIQSEKLSSLGKMAEGVIHEINDPMNFLINILPDLRQDLQGLERVRNLTIKCVADPNTVSEIEKISKKYELESHLEEMDFVFDRATKALNKSTQIAGSLNVFSSSSRQVETRTTNLLDVAQDAIKLIPIKMLGETKISVGREESCLWPVNPSEMQQVFINLIHNAVDAMQKKGTIEIWGAKKKHAVLVSICDSGPGIPAEIQNQIFDPFFTTKPAGQGTGLGLSISAEIIRKFGGNLTVESIENQGTCFHIRFTQDSQDR